MRIASIGYIEERFALKQVICCQNRQRFSANHLDKVASSSIYAVFRNKIYQMQQSSSVWGCGLKSDSQRLHRHCRCVILRVRMWIEIHSRLTLRAARISHPPCEDVDWNSLASPKHRCTATVILRVRMWIEIDFVSDCPPYCHVILRVRMWIEIRS